MLGRIQDSHVDAVARLHQLHLTGLLKDLGLPAIRAFYTGAIGLPDTIGFVWLNNDEVAGFVMGSSEPRDLQKRVFKSNVLGVLSGTALGIARHPSTIRWLFDSISEESEAYKTEVPELTYLAVDPRFRRSRIGERLVDKFGEAVKTRGFGSFELSVDTDNQSARRFYACKGFLKKGEYREYGVDHVRLSRRLD